MKKKKFIMVFKLAIVCIFLMQTMFVFATNYTVSTKTDLQNKMNAALPGDTVIIANGIYNNWGAITFTNNNGTSSSAWIVLKAQTFRGVNFTGSAYLQFKGTHVRIDGLRFANGNAGTNAVISFRSSSSSLANYCRVSNIIIDNFNTTSSDTSTQNEWIGLFGTNNRVDHCTFINKVNPRATVVVWYSSTTYPNPATSTYHRIDSNYFKGRSYQGDNGGETIRVGDSNSSRTNGFNTIEYNLFEDCTQNEPEIISNKSNFNIYRYNTFKNSSGGLTLRHGRYCSVYGNFFIVNNASVVEAYGVRAIDKGHKIFNNYFEGLNGNQSGGTSQLRSSINLYNGVSTDTTDIDYSYQYFAADSCIVAFNTIVNAKGGGGIVLGGIGGGTIQPKGIVLANNLIKMAQGTAVYLNPINTALTYAAVGNIYQAPSGLGLTFTTGFTTATLNFGTSVNGILPPPSLVQDAAINSSIYASLLNGIDAQGQPRSTIYDVGCDEVNESTTVINSPLDSNIVGAGKPVQSIVPVNLERFKAQFINENVVLYWNVSNEINFQQYNVEWSVNGYEFITLAIVDAKKIAAYQYKHTSPLLGNNYYRLKMIDKDGSYQYSPICLINVGKKTTVNFYPNPAKDFINIDINGTLNALTEIVLYDAMGREIKRMKMTNNSIKFSVVELTTGMYHLSIIEMGQVKSNHPLMITK